MKYLLFIFAIVVKITIPYLPVWNLKKTRVKLVSQSNCFIYLFSKTINGIHLSFSKEIIAYDKITTYNKVSIEGENVHVYFQPKWENIDDFYVIDNKYYVCPTGKNFLTKINNNGQKSSINPKNYTENEEWELKCYYDGNGRIYFAFLNNPNSPFYYFNASISNYEIYQYKFDNLDIFLDFKWIKILSEDNSTNYNYLLILFLNSSYIYLKIYKYETIPKKYFNFNPYKEKEIQKIIENSNYISYFSNNSNICYWVFYNETNFISGYTTFNIEEKTGEINNINSVINNKSPLIYLNKIKIELIQRYRNTDYIYYKLIDSENVHYYGIIDIKINKVILNTDTEVTPLINKALLTMMDSTAYEVCFIKMNDGQELCQKQCQNGTKMVLDADKGNYCSTSENCTNYKLLPEEICVNNCDENINIIEEQNCFLCKNVFDNLQYTVKKNKTCLENKPKNSYYINEELKIIDYCMEYCDKCSNSQKCEVCGKNYFKLEDKEICVKQCPEKYYQKENDCLNCHKNCKTCLKSYDENNQNCETCDTNSEYKYLIKAKNFPSNCVNECPEGTNGTNISIDKLYCLSNSEKEEEEKEEKDSKVFIYILIPALIIVFLLIGFILIKTYKKYKNKKNFEKLLNKDIPLYKIENVENQGKVKPYSPIGNDNISLNNSLSNSSQRYMKTKD